MKLTFAKCPKCRFDRNGFAYATTAFGASLMNNVFNFFYVKVFVNLYHVTPAWFQAAQIIFLVWNAVNDPLFGYLQDHAGHWHCLRSRRLSILYGAPFFVLSFLSFWFPLGPYATDRSLAWLSGTHLVVSLCLYDALFTFVLLAHCCLVTEMSTTYHARLDMKWYGVLAGLCASWSVAFTNWVSDDLQSTWRFQLACVLLAVLSCASMVYTGVFAVTIYDKRERDPESRTESAVAPPLLDSHTEDDEQHKDKKKKNISAYLSLTMDILRNRNFEAFVWTNFFQVFHIQFLSNFTAIFCDFLLPQLSTASKSVFYAVLFVAPSLFVVLGKPIITRYGYFNLLRCNFIYNIVAAVLMLLCGRQWPAPVVLYIFLNTVLVQSCYALIDLALSDIADEDKEKHQRKKPISSMIFGTNALVTKPAQSLAPMLVMAILNRSGYQQLLDTKNTLTQTVSAATNWTQTVIDNFTDTTTTTTTVMAQQAFSTEIVTTKVADTMFLVACLLPLGLGLVQLVSWSCYNIRATHLNPHPVEQVDETVVEE